MYFLISRREKEKNRIGGHMKLPIEFEFFYPFLNPFWTTIGQDVNNFLFIKERIIWIARWSVINFDSCPMMQ